MMNHVSYLANKQPRYLSVESFSNHFDSRSIASRFPVGAAMKKVGKYEDSPRNEARHYHHGRRVQ